MSDNEETLDSVGEKEQLSSLTEVLAKQQKDIEDKIREFRLAGGVSNFNAGESLLFPQGHFSKANTFGTGKFGQQTLMANSPKAFGNIKSSQKDNNMDFWKCKFEALERDFQHFKMGQKSVQPKTRLFEVPSSSEEEDDEAEFREKSRTAKALEQQKRLYKTTHSTIIIWKSHYIPSVTYLVWTFVDILLVMETKHSIMIREARDESVMAIRNLQHLFAIQEEDALELDRVVDTINHYRGLRFPKEDPNHPGPSTVQSLAGIKDSPKLKSTMKLAPERPEYVMSIKHPNNEARCERCNFPTPVLSFLVSHMKNHQGESPPYIRFPKDSLYFCQPKSENGQPIYTTTIRVPVECVGFFMGPKGTKKESLKGSLKDFQVDLWQFNMRERLFHISGSAQAIWNFQKELIKLLPPVLFEWKSKFLREVIPRPYPDDYPFLFDMDPDVIVHLPKLCSQCRTTRHTMFTCENFLLQCKACYELGHKYKQCPVRAVFAHY